MKAISVSISSRVTVEVGPIEIDKIDGLIEKISRNFLEKASFKIFDYSPSSKFVHPVNAVVRIKSLIQS